MKPWITQEILEPWIKQGISEEQFDALRYKPDRNAFVRLYNPQIPVERDNRRLSKETLEVGFFPAVEESVER